MISITSAPEAPPPRIRILDSRAREVETVRIGDKLTFRIEIPEDSEFDPRPFCPSRRDNTFTTRVLCGSALRYIRKKLRGHGQGLEEHVPDNRRRRVSRGSDHLPRVLARRQRPSIHLRSVPVHGIVRRDIPVQRQILFGPVRTGNDLFPRPTTAFFVPRFIRLSLFGGKMEGRIRPVSLGTGEGATFSTRTYFRQCLT